jgi:mevalonate kinase
MVRWKEMKILPEAIASNASLKRLLVIWNITVRTIWFGYFDIEVLKGYWNWNVFWFHIHKVGSSGALVAAIYDKYAQDKITVLENPLAKNYYS